MRVTIQDIQQMKRCGEKIGVVTAYDYATARLVEEVGVPMILGVTALATPCWATILPCL